MNTAYWVNTIMNTLFSSGRVFYIGLSSTAPDVDGTGFTEPSGGNYSRVRLNTFTLSEQGSVTNKAAIIFPASANEWFPITAKATHWLMFDGDGDTANLLASGELSEPVAISLDVSARINAGGIVITLSDSQ